MTSMLRIAVCCLALVACTASCKIYKFTGASVNAETIYIGNFPNLAPIQSDALSDIFIRNLRNKILRETRLNTASTEDAEVQLTGSIRDYYVSPSTISGTEEVAQNRLTIVIQVDYVDTTDPDKSFSQRFSDGENFDATANLLDVEESLIQVITQRISESIFNKAFVNW